MDSLGKYIRGCRTAKGLSMREISEISGISHTEVFRIEIGKREYHFAEPTVIASSPTATVTSAFDFSFHSFITSDPVSPTFYDIYILTATQSVNADTFRAALQKNRREPRHGGADGGCGRRHSNDCRKPHHARPLLAYP